jgi:hypothetical protein
VLVSSNDVKIKANVGQIGAQREFRAQGRWQSPRGIDNFSTHLLRGLTSPVSNRYRCNARSCNQASVASLFMKWSTDCSKAIERLSNPNCNWPFWSVIASFTGNKRYVSE